MLNINNETIKIWMCLLTCRMGLLSCLWTNEPTRSCLESLMPSSAKKCDSYLYFCICICLSTKENLVRSKLQAFAFFFNFDCSKQFSIQEMLRFQCWVIEKSSIAYFLLLWIFYDNEQSFFIQDFLKSRYSILRFGG